MSCTKASVFESTQHYLQTPRSRQLGLDTGLRRQSQYSDASAWVVALSLLSWNMVGCDRHTAVDLRPVAQDPTAFIESVTPGEPAIRKLTRDQFVSSIHDVFNADIAVPPTAEPDFIAGGLASVGASTTPYSPRGVESFEQAAYAVANLVLTTPEIRVRIMVCEPIAIVDSSCAQQIIEPIARVAWRRNLTEDELARLVGVVNSAAQTLSSFNAGLEFGLAAILQSPFFLYRFELGQSGRFTDYELASRLAYFLWNSTPDIELLDAAEAGQLSTDEGLRASAARLLSDPRARTGMRRFFIEYLHLEELLSLSKDPSVFAFYTTDLGESALEETLSLLDYLVFERDADYRALLTTTTTFVNPTLAALYDIPAPSSEGFARVNLPPSGPRAGLLGHAGFLSAHSHPVSTSVTLRGKAVRNILLCQEIPIPPVEVDTSIPEPSGTAPTMRERVAEHLESESCAACHLMTDPIGLGLENFDGVGRYRLLDNGHMIDPTGDLDGTDFLNARELGAAVASHPDYLRCLVRTMTRYATGRVETKKELETHITTLTNRFISQGSQVQGLALDIVLSPMFRRAGEGG